MKKSLFVISLLAAAAGLSTGASALEISNGLAFNGLAFNGLAFNGLAFNGLAFNGLAFNGLAFNGSALTGTEFPAMAAAAPKSTIILKDGSHITLQ